MPFQRRLNKIAVVGFAGFLADFTITHFRMPRIGPVMMATLLRDRKYEVKMFAEGVKPFDEYTISYICSADVVAISVLTYGANRAYALISLIRMQNPESIIIMGDVHPTVLPEDSLRYCDYVVRGEGDETLLELLDNLNQKPGSPRLSEIRGLSYWEDEQIVHNGNRPRPENIEIIPDLSLVHTFYENAGIKSVLKGRMTMAVAQASRGCPIACKFCLGSAILGKTYRKRGVEGVIDNMKNIRRAAKGKKITLFFIDNHFFIDKRWTKAILKRVIEEKFNFRVIVFGQYFIGKDEEMLTLMNQANFKRVFVGFESINPNTLKEFNKRQSEQSMRDNIQKIQAHGINIHGSFMLGGESDTMETVQATIDFAIDTNIMSASFFGLCEYPFENYNFIPTTNVLPPIRLLPKSNLNFYNLNFVSIYPKKMRPSQLQRGLIEAHERFLSKNRITHAIKNGNWKDARNRLVGIMAQGSAQKKMINQMKDYLPFLEAAEKGKYDKNDCLIEENLTDEPFQFENPNPGLYNHLVNLPRDKFYPARALSSESINHADEKEVLEYYSK